MVVIILFQVDPTFEYPQNICVISVCGFFILQISALDAERERQVSEKQASLEMMTRAAATATKEAGMKQELLNKLTTQMDSLVRQCN